MKFFTLGFYQTRNDWQSKPKRPGPVEHPWTRYAHHLEEMVGSLPADLLALARLPSPVDAAKLRGLNFHKRGIIQYLNTKEVFNIGS